MKQTNQQANQRKRGLPSGERIYRVTFLQPPRNPDKRTEFYFHSIAAIYDEFTSTEIGANLRKLWKHGLAVGIPYEGEQCRITQEPIHRKRHKANVSGDKSNGGINLPPEAVSPTQGKTKKNNDN